MTFFKISQRYQQKTTILSLEVYSKDTQCGFFLRVENIKNITWVENIKNVTLVENSYVCFFNLLILTCGISLDLVLMITITVCTYLLHFIILEIISKTQ